MTPCDEGTTNVVARIGYCMGCHRVHRLVDFLCVPCARRVDPDYARLVRRVHLDPAFALMVHERFGGSVAGKRFVRELGYEPGAAAEQDEDGGVRCARVGTSSPACVPPPFQPPSTDRPGPSSPTAS